MSIARFTRAAAILAAAAASLFAGQALAADPTGGKINHILILMLENRTFDSYLGQLATKGYYHRPGTCFDQNHHPCANQEVDGLTCTLTPADLPGCVTDPDDASGYCCLNFNPKSFDTSDNQCSPGAERQYVFHDASYCTADTNHEWDGTHHEFNQCDPTSPTGDNDGFYVQNLGATDRLMTDGLRTEAKRSLGFYDDTDLPFYYSLASKFAISDRYFCSILGPTIPNRMYQMAGTSFGHVNTVPDLLPPPGGYTPTTGNVFKSLNAAGVTWKNYFHDLPQAGLMDNRDATPDHFADINQLFVDLAIGNLPQVAFIDPPFTQPQLILPDTSLNVFSGDEHPPKDIQFGQQLAARVVNAVLSSPYWTTSGDVALFINYDEHGGFYDHVPPPTAPDADGILPGDCPAQSEGLLAPGTPLDPLTQPLAEQRKAIFCAEPELKIPFDHLGIRVPFYVVSPYARRHYVSHTVLDHTSLLRFIEERFGLAPLTARDAAANLPLDVFDFSKQDKSVPPLTQPGVPRIDPLLDPHCYEGVEVF